MTFVGFVVSKSGIGMDPAKVAAILEWPTPTSVKEVQSFLGFANFYKKFILHYSSLTIPLTSLTRKGVRFTWSPAADAAFRQLQQAFTSAPVLQHHQPELPITIEADASDFALGCILSHLPCWRFTSGLFLLPQVYTCGAQLSHLRQGAASCGGGIRAVEGLPGSS